MRQLSVRPTVLSSAAPLQHQPDYPRPAVAPLRFLGLGCGALLTDCTDSRELRLLQASNERFQCVGRANSAGELTRLIPFEACYLALAATLRPADVVDEIHPSFDLVKRSTAHLPLLPEDADLAAQLTGIYRVSGWETLDREAIVEWCSRVRGAVVRYLQAGGNI